MSKNILGTNLVVQVGLVVHDIEATARKYADFLGQEIPTVIVTDIPEEARTQYRGAPTPARAKLAFFNVGPTLTLELIEPDHAPSTWREELDKKGEGVHHLAFVVEGMREKIAALDAQGIPLLQTGEYKGGRYAYLDGSKDLKTIIELLEND
jgi:catechol 2,3-dioxygenase-like lactoylglutathione lyase family enzyme